MATAPQRQPKQGPPAQQEPPKHVSPLDNLQAMMNMVLITSGNYLKEQRDGGGAGRSQFSMKRTIPVAFERFHISLDELEMEVRQAQAVLRRDLALLQADRIKREQAEAAERQRLAAASSAKKLAPTLPQPAATTTSEPPATQPKPATTQPPATIDNPTVEKKTVELPPPITTTSEVPERDPLFDPTPTTANPQDTDFDFDAMFGDNLGDSGDASNDQDVDMDAPNADLSFNLDESGPSLLRGLEDFAKAGDEAPEDTNMDIDFAMPDLPDLGTTQAPVQQAAAKSESAPAAPPPPVATDPADQFDAMATDNFDDLFSMDEPESTEFDDAFFGFGAD